MEKTKALQGLIISNGYFNSFFKNQDSIDSVHSAVLPCPDADSGVSSIGIALKLFFEAVCRDVTKRGRFDIYFDKFLSVAGIDNSIKDKIEDVLIYALVNELYPIVDDVNRTPNDIEEAIEMAEIIIRYAFLSIFYDNKNDAENLYALAFGVMSAYTPECIIDGFVNYFNGTLDNVQREDGYDGAVIDWIYNTFVCEYIPNDCTEAEFVNMIFSEPEPVSCY